MKKPMLTTALVMAFSGAVLAAPALARSASASATEAAGTDAPLSLPRPKAGRTRPLVVVVAENAGAETTDFVIPYGVLKDSGVAEVLSLSTGEGPVQLLRAIRIRADQTITAFDAAQPAGADIVVVPAQMDPNDPVLLAWIRSQVARGAVVVAVCEGARVLARAGLLEGRRATSHWSALNDLNRAYPHTEWVRDRRYVQDGNIISTTGVTAALPMSLALVEAIGGWPAAQATADRLGVVDWSARHRTEDFSLSRMDFVRAVRSALAFWSHERVEMPLVEGQDEIALALRTDVWTRWPASRVVTTSTGAAPVTSRHGIVVLPDGRPEAGSFVVPSWTESAAAQLGRAVDELTGRYGPVAHRVAVSGLEYDPPASAR